MRFIGLLLILVLSSDYVYADREVFERKTRLDIENTITEVLRKHCGEEWAFERRSRII